MFIKQNSDHMLCYEPAPGEHLDEFTLNMLREENPGQIPVVGREEDRLLLPVSFGPGALEAVRQGSPVQPILLSLFQAVREARRCMIPVSELLLNAHYLYINKDTREVVLLCLPAEYASQYSQDPRELFLTIAAAGVFKDNPEWEKNLDLLCYLNSEEYSLEGLVQYLNRPREEKKEEAPRKSRLQAFLSGDTQELPEIRAYGGPDDAYSLVLRSTGQEFPLGKHDAVIGSDPAKADICLRCNAFVDPEHAKLTWERGSYYIEDLHSHAGIRRNSRKVRLWRPERLEPGDVLKIGEDELVFSCRNMPK